LHLSALVKKWFIDGVDDPEKPRNRAIEEAEREMHAAGFKLQTKVTAPLSNDCRRPESTLLWNWTPTAQIASRV
jgi:hypothetical protein